MKQKNPPPATFAFGYKNPPPSGNDINGLGVSKQVQARHVFHNATGEALPWNALDEFFSQINVWGVVKHMLANVWQLVMVQTSAGVPETLRWLGSGTTFTVLPNSLLVFVPIAAFVLLVSPRILWQQTRLVVVGVVVLAVVYLAFITGR
mgnify:CR=1 FL=1